MAGRNNAAGNVGGTFEQQRAALAAAQRGIPLPDGLTLDNNEEKQLWRQYTSARHPKDWKTLDLVLVHKAVKLEMRIREMWEELDRIGYLLENARGTVTGNPMVTAIHQVQNQQLAIIRTLQLTELSLGDKDSRAKRAEGAQEAAKGAGQQDDAMDLLAHTDPVTGTTLYEVDSK